MANQTWDDFLLDLAEDYLAPSLKQYLDRRLASELVIPGAEMTTEFAAWRRRRARV